MKRPRIISTICVIGYLSILFSFPQVFSPSIKKLGVFVPAVYGTLVALTFISYVGLWYMKEWGAVLFVSAFFGRTIFFIVTEQLGATFVLSVLFSIFATVVLLRRYREFDPNF